MSEAETLSAREMVPDDPATLARSRAPKRRSEINLDGQTVTIHEPSGAKTEFGFGAMPEPIKLWLGLHGLARHLLAQDDPGAAHDALQSGELPVARKVAEPKQRSAWRQAIAAALVEAAKKDKRTYTQEQANARVDAISRDDLRSWKTDPLVVKHYRRITGIEPNSGVTALLNDERAAV